MVSSDLLLEALARQAFPLRFRASCCHCPPVILCALALLHGKCWTGCSAELSYALLTI